MNRVCKYIQPVSSKTRVVMSFSFLSLDPFSATLLAQEYYCSFFSTKHMRKSEGQESQVKKGRPGDDMCFSDTYQFSLSTAPGEVSGICI